MNLPKMIIFDAGKTLIDYLPKDDIRGRKSLMSYLTTVDATELLMEHIVSNPHNYDAQTIDRITNETFEKYDVCRKNLFEVHEQTILKTAHDVLDIKFSISYDEIESIIWNHSADIIEVEGVREVLDALNEMGIRTAVISNLDFSGYLLEERLNSIFPNNRFEFVIASSDYGVRKPQPLLFEIGIAQSGLKANEIWYVGDKVKVDVDGSQTVGMIPVLFKNKRNTYTDIPEDIIVIEEYCELVKILQRIHSQEI